MTRSDYYTSLSGDVKSRYDEKIKIIDNIDPYAIPLTDCNLDIMLVPNITIVDLMNYLILSHSFYTGQQFKAYKSTQAYKQYEAGSIQEIVAKQITKEAFVVISKVKHSQKKREKSLEVWVIILEDTSISSAHCTCMAGLSEVCSHVAAVLFYLHARPTTIEDSGPGPSSTEKLSIWPVPPMKNVDMVRVKDMDWSKKTKKLSQKHAPALGSNELIDFLTKIEDMGLEPAICRVLEPFASKIELNQPQDLPPSLDNWYSTDMVGKSYDVLLYISQQLDMAITVEHIEAIEKATREQSKNNTWFKYRAGRITASRFKSVCRTSIEKPSLSVVKGVCYPQKVIFNCKETSYGMKHEKDAIEAYRMHVLTQHQNFTVTASGFVISHKHPELGASPDGLVMCDCCGMGCLEVKCPYLLKDSFSLEEYASKKHTCLIYANNSFYLDHSHCYYYQIQCQMFVTGRKYSDFVIWSKQIMFIERVAYDDKFCSENISKALDFHKYVIKPELLGRYFTEKGGVGKVTLWCLCQKPDDDRPMLRCDNDDCKIQWFHYECINISEMPATWFCENCI